MLIKLDLKKAYDNLNWELLRDTLMQAGFPSSWINIIMNCTTTNEMQLLWNGFPFESFTLMRGIRQGDLLSPYLFVLCIERLSHMIMDAINEGAWKPVSIAKSGLKLSHLFFVDDIVLFAEASMDQMAIIKQCLDNFLIGWVRK